MIKKAAIFFVHGEINKNIYALLFSFNSII